MAGREDAPREAEIVQVMLAQLRQHPTIRAALPEFPLGKTARIDLLGIYPGELHGYEVKSAYDRLTRIRRQARAYNRHCSHVTLLLDPQHVAQAQALVPGWWGLVLVTRQRRTLVFQQLRPALPNEGFSPAAMLGLLWREELRHLLRHLDHPKGVSRLSHARLVSTVQRYLDPQTIVSVVAFLLAERQLQYPRRQGFCT